MKITLTGTDFNRIMRVCGPAVSKDDVRESLQHIELQCNGRARAKDAPRAAMAVPWRKPVSPARESGAP